MKNIVKWSVLLIAIDLHSILGVPTGTTGGDYKLEILSKNSPNSRTTANSGLADKIDLTGFYETVAKKVVPALLSSYETGAAPGKETTHHIGKSVTESLTQTLSDAFHSKIGKEVLIAAGIKKQPTAFENLIEAFMACIKWAGNTVSSKVHDVRSKGLIRTFSDTVTGTFRSRSIESEFTPLSEANRSGISSGNNGNTQPEEDVMDTRDLGHHRHHDRFGYGGRPPSIWDRIFYQRYDHNPYHNYPGPEGGPFGFIGYIISSFINTIQEFFHRLYYGPPPPPPPPRVGLFGRPRY